MKQTAVEWFIINLIQVCGAPPEGTWKEAENLLQQAKEMEKEQIINAREDGHVSTYAEYGETPKCYLDGGHEQYYNETFKSE
jgi:hypothetical protein